MGSQLEYTTSKENNNMKSLFIAFFALFPTMAISQEYQQWIVSPPITYPLVVFDSVQYNSEIFVMSPGSCIKGPLVIKHINGTVALSLDADSDFPAGCSKKGTQ